MEYLSVKEGSNNDPELYYYPFVDADLAGYLNVRDELFNDGHIFLPDGEDLQLIYYYGGEDRDVLSSRDYKARVVVEDSNHETCYDVAADLQFPDTADVWKDGEGTLHPRQAIRITVPSAVFADLSKGDVSATLESFRNGQDWSDHFNGIRFRRENGGIVLAYSLEGLDMHGRMSFPNVLLEIWYIAVPGILLLEIVLFILSIIRNRYMRSQLAVCVFGVFYSSFALHYFDHLPGYGMFAEFAHLGEVIALYIAAIGFVILTIILAIIYGIVHVVRENRRLRKSVAETTEKQQEEETK